MRIATWNVNSIHARLPRLLPWLQEQQPDVVCLQETKTTDDKFPVEALTTAGYNVVFHGQKSYNGVAILARGTIEDVQVGMGDPALDIHARLIAATVAGIRIICVYVPNGASLKDDKCLFKVAWLNGLRRYLDERHSCDDALIVAGDFNIATRDVDLTDAEKWHKTVLAHPSMRAAFAQVTDFDLVDIFAAHHPQGGLFSWWDYRTGSYDRGTGGLRIDGILATPCVSGRAVHSAIHHLERGKERPSDHVPVCVELIEAN